MMVIEIQGDIFETIKRTLYVRYKAFQDGKLIFPWEESYPHNEIDNPWVKISEEGLFYPKYAVYLSQEKGNKLLEEYESLVVQGLYEPDDLASIIQRYSVNGFNHIGGNVFHIVSGNEGVSELLKSAMVKSIDTKRVKVD